MSLDGCSFYFGENESESDRKSIKNSVTSVSGTALKVIPSKLSQNSNVNNEERLKGKFPYLEKFEAI